MALFNFLDFLCENEVLGYNSGILILLYMIQVSLTLDAAEIWLMDTLGEIEFVKVFCEDKVVNMATDTNLLPQIYIV